MLRLLVLVALSSTALANPLDVKAVTKQIAHCDADAVAKLGGIEQADTIGKRPKEELVHLVGKKARGYVVFVDGSCHVVPVTGKPLAFAKGSFGGGATTAFALSAAGCGQQCMQVVSLKKGDVVVDVMPLPDPCEDGITLTKRKWFANRDSLELACFTSGGADQSRTDMILDTGSGNLRVELVVPAGTAWVQVSDTGPRCTARAPGGIKVVATGAKPQLDVTIAATPEEADAAKIEWTSGGCEAIVKTHRFEYDGETFVGTKTAPKVWVAKKLCRCKK